MTRKIYLGGKFSGVFTLIDNEDYERVSYHGWCFSGGYALARINKKTVMLHRFILGCSDSKVDHINHNTLDNRKENLRWVNDTQNGANRKPYGKNSVYKGVRPKNGGWEANITINKTQKYLGMFELEIDAAKAYDNEALKAHKEFAYLNFGR